MMKKNYNCDKNKFHFKKANKKIIDFSIYFYYLRKNYIGF